MAHNLLIGLCFFFAASVASVTGFGSNIIGLPLLTMLIGLDGGKQSLIVLGAIMYLGLFLRARRQVNWREFATIALLAAIGLPIGMLLYAHLPARLSIILLGLFVVGVGLRNLLRAAGARDRAMRASSAPQDDDPRRPTRWAWLLLLGGGIVHGAFTTGGPLLIVYADKTLPHKSVFRATLSLMWLTLDVLLIAGWSISHTWSVDTGRLVLIGLPFTIIGLIVGDWVHHRVNERNFRGVVNIMLVLIGLMLIMSKT